MPVLSKPFRRSDLIATVSGLVSRATTRKWASLPPAPKAALRETIATFDRTTMLMERGEPLSRDEVDAACAPLIASVINSQYRPLLWAVRGYDNYTYVHSLRMAVLLTLFGHSIGIGTAD